MLVVLYFKSTGSFDVEVSEVLEAQEKMLNLRLKNEEKGTFQSFNSFEYFFYT